MRYDKGHKEITRKRIVEVAATEFRKSGIGGIGVADVMSRAGLTHGGFYSHFSSKEDLVQEALDECSSQSRLRRIAEQGGNLEEMIRCYLRPEHRDHPERGCPVATLVEEVTRHEKPTRACFAANIARLITLIESHLPVEKKGAARKKAAMAIFATLIGTLQLARLMKDAEISDEILQAGIEAACSLAKIRTQS